MSTPRKTPPPEPAPEKVPEQASDHELVFIDAIEDAQARLLSGVDAFNVPVRLLPPGAREGAWLRWSMVPAPAPPDDGATLRKKLGAPDDGQDIKL